MKIGTKVRKILSLVMAIAMICTILPAGIAFADEAAAVTYETVMKGDALEYYSFESGLQGWTTTSGTTLGTISHDTETAANGIGSAKLDMTNAYNVFVNTTATTFTKGTYYVLSAKVKAENAAAGTQAKFVFYDKTANDIVSIDGVQDFGLQQIDEETSERLYRTRDEYAVPVTGSDWVEIRQLICANTATTGGNAELTTWSANIGVWVEGSAQTVYLDEVRVEDAMTVGFIGEDDFSTGKNIGGWQNYGTTFTIDAATATMTASKTSGGFNRLQRPVFLKQFKTYKMSGDIMVHSNANTTAEQKAAGVAQVSLNVSSDGGTQDPNHGFAKQVAVKTNVAYDQWHTVEKIFTHKTADVMLHFVASCGVGAGYQYSVKNLKLEEVSTFEYLDPSSGTDAWMDHGVAHSVVSNVTYGEGTNSIYVPEKTTSYFKAYAPVVLRDGYTYNFKTAVKVDTVADADLSEASDLVNFWVTNKTNVATTNFNETLGGIQYDLVPGEGNEWVEIEFDYTHVSNKESDLAFITIMPRGGAVTNRAHWIGALSITASDASSATAGITSVTIGEDGAPVYTANANRNYVLGYKYYLNGEVAEFGWTAVGEAVPAYSAAASLADTDDLQVSLTPVLVSGKQEATVASGDIVVPEQPGEGGGEDPDEPVDPEDPEDPVVPDEPVDVGTTYEDLMKGSALEYYSFEDGLGNWITTSGSEWGTVTNDKTTAAHGIGSAKLIMANAYNVFLNTEPTTFVKDKYYVLSAKVKVENPFEGTQIKFVLYDEDCVDTVNIGSEADNFVDLGLQQVDDQETMEHHYRTDDYYAIPVTTSDWVEIRKLIRVTTDSEGNAELTSWSAKLGLWVEGGVQTVYIDEVRVEDAQTVGFIGVDDFSTGKNIGEWRDFGTTHTIDAETATMTLDKGAGYHRIQKPVFLKQYRTYKMSGDIMVHSNESLTEEQLAAGVAQVSLNVSSDGGTQDPNHGFAKQVAVKTNAAYDEWHTLEKTFVATKDEMLHFVASCGVGAGFQYSVKNLKLEEVSTFEYLDPNSGIDAWQNHGLTHSVVSDVTYGEGTKSIYVPERATSYFKIYAPLVLRDGYTYNFKTAVKVDIAADADLSGDQDFVNFWVTDQAHLATTNNWEILGGIQYDLSADEANEWVEIEFEYTHVSDKESDLVYLTIMNRGGVATNRAHWVGMVSVETTGAPVVATAGINSVELGDDYAPVFEATGNKSYILGYKYLLNGTVVETGWTSTGVPAVPAYTGAAELTEYDNIQVELTPVLLSGKQEAAVISAPTGTNTTEALVTVNSVAILDANGEAAANIAALADGWYVEAAYTNTTTETATVWFMVAFYGENGLLSAEKYNVDLVVSEDVASAYIPEGDDLFNAPASGVTEVKAFVWDVNAKPLCAGDSVAAN